MKVDWHDYVYLKGRGFQNYSGFLGGVVFEDGKSIRKVTETDINAIVANQRVVIIDESGKEQAVGWAARQAYESRQEKLALLQKVNENESRQKQQSASGAAEQTGRNNSEISDLSTEVTGDGRASPVGGSVQPAQQFEEHQEVHDQLKVYTQAELIAVADKQGIEGLRSIGKQYDVRAKTIENLIDQ